MSDFVERSKPEPIEAFRVDFEEPEMAAKVLDAFGAGQDNFTLRVVNGEWSLSFPRPRKQQQQATASVDGPGYYTISLVIPGGGDGASGDVVVKDGAWVVTTYSDTDYPQVSVMDDQSFQRKYRAGAFQPNQ